MANRIRIGIIGIEGAYGKWLKVLLSKDSKSDIFGTDTTKAEYPPNHEIIKKSDIIIFATPLNITAKLIQDNSQHFNSNQLCLDIASIKHDVVEALRQLPCESASIHPLMAPSKGSWKGQTVTLTKIKINKWSRWLTNFLNHSQAKIEYISAKEHDQIMSFVQVLPHSLLITMASVLSDLDLFQIDKFTTPTYRLLKYSLSRVFSLQSDLFADIQFLNRSNSEKVLDGIVKNIEKIRSFLKNQNRDSFISFIDHIKENLDTAFLENNVENYNRILKFEADFTKGYCIRILCKKDYPGLLLDILSIFKKNTINLISLHSQQKDGFIIFDIGVEELLDDTILENISQGLDGFGKII